MLSYKKYPMLSIFEKKIETLKIFQWIQKEVVQDILNKAEKKEFHPWECIMKQGDESDGYAYIIENGSVDIYVGKQKIVTLQSGDMFWEIAILSEDPRSASAVSQKDTLCLCISRSMLFDMIEHDDNSINREIMRRMEENLEIEEHDFL